MAIYIAIREKISWMTIFHANRDPKLGYVTYLTESNFDDLCMTSKFPRRDRSFGSRQQKNLAINSSSRETFGPENESFQKPETLFSRKNPR